MASSPLKKHAFAYLEKIGDEGVFEMIANGASVSDIARQFGLLRSAVSTWCNREERKHLYDEARRQAAATLMEQCLRIADSATSENVQAAKLQVDTRRFLAGAFDPSVWGQKPTLAINISAGEAHLSALRKRNTQALEQASVVTLIEREDGE